MYRQQIAQRCRRTLIDQFGVFLIIAVLAALYRLLQGTHDIRVIGVIFAAVDVLQQAARANGFARQPGAFGEIQQILLEVIKARAADTADHALEAQVYHIIVQSDRFKQFGAAVRGNGRNAHFGHNLVQPLVDAVTVVLHHGTVVFGDGLGINQTPQRFVGQVRIDGRCAKAEQYRKVMRIAGASGFYDDVGVAAQALFHQTRLHRAHRHRRGHRQAILTDIAIREDQQHGAVAHHLFRFIAQRFNRRVQCGFGDIKGNVKPVGAVVMLAHGSELFEIRVQQNWRFKTQAMGLTFRFAEDVHFATDAGGERHDVRFTQRVDRRVSDLRELLAEVVVNNTRLAGEHGKGGIVAH